jgi:tetratricopeptide (TPR) repeat protein
MSICALFLVAIWPAAVHAQDSGNDVNAYHGNGAEITVIVHDASGEPIAASALVSIYRDANMPSGQATTSRGSASFTVPALGEFVVVAEAAGYQRVEKDISVPAPERALVDVYLRRDSTAKMPAGVPGKPVLAPKARQMLDKALQALSTDDLGAAKKYLADVAKLAPAHPDVLYAQGVLYLKRREWEQAQGVLEKATQLDPNHAQAFAALGMALSDQGKYAEAVAPLETAFQLNATAGWDTHWALAKAYYEQTRYDDALKTSQLALEESKGKAPQIELLVAQSLTAVGRYEDAAQELRGFLKEHSERPEAAMAGKWLERLKSSGKIK